MNVNKIISGCVLMLLTLFITSAADSKIITIWNASVIPTFVPSTVNASLGDTIKFTGNGDFEIQHSSVCDGRPYTSRPEGALPWNFPHLTMSGFLYVLKVPGTYVFICAGHYESGRINVSAPLELNLTALIQGFYNNISHRMIKDSVSVYLRQSSSPYSLVDSVRGVLDSIGHGVFTFVNAPSGSNYFLVVKHRNLIETWSSSAQSFISNALTYDFSSADSQAYGGNLKQVDISPVRYACYNGDINQDGFVNLTDIISIHLDAFNFVSGYKVTDITGDNFTNLTDLILCYNNSERFTSKITP